MAEVRERDLVLAPNEFAYILDETKGHVVVYVGPHKTSMANTDRPVNYDAEHRRFRRCNLEEAITTFPFAEEGWYIVLENPAKSGDQEHPAGGPNTLPRLTPGRKINIPGPTTFPLWPGQVARVVRGHQLRSNQYLVVQVYNEEAARENWAKAVIKPQRLEGSTGAEEGGPHLTETPDLITGKLLVIRGTDVSFYIPPTGIEVVQDAKASYLRDAVTLERLEYCILLDEDGNKRFIQGPAVVFPRPTETFVERQGSRKFRVIELNEISGIYVKVIAPYTDEKGVEHRVGEELFITGKDQMIYFPRPEHAIIRHGDREIHYAVAIPAGEARYVLDRLTGEVGLRRGPLMFLPDPRREVIVRRVLEPREVELLFPGDVEAQDYHRALAASGRAPLGDLFEPRTGVGLAPTAPARELDAAPSDEQRRKGQSRQPRTITLHSKYEGAVTVDVLTGYAVLVVGRSGQRKVIAGPQTYPLEYDETLEVVTLSTGTPKSEEATVRTAYLRVLNNKVSDIVEAETRDMCQVKVRLSYRVNFEGDPERWFDVENYVKFLVDHSRSMLRNAIKRRGVEEFYASSIDIVRDQILGQAGPEGTRPGRRFLENGMHIYDVEVLDVKLGDQVIEKYLATAQHDAVRQAILVAEERRRLEVTRQTEEIKRLLAATQSETVRRQLELKGEEVQRQLVTHLLEIDSQARSDERKLTASLARQEVLGQIHEAELSRDRTRQAFDQDVARQQLTLRLDELKAEVQSVVEKAQAISPDLVAALQAFSDRHLVGKLSESMAPLAILGGESVADVVSRLLKNTPLERVLLPPDKGP